MPQAIDQQIAKHRDAVRRRPSEVAQQIWLLAALAVKRGLREYAGSAFVKMYRMRSEWTQLHYDVICYWADHEARRGSLVEIFERSRDQAPHDPIRHYSLGLALQAVNHQGRAIEVYEDAIRLAPGLAVAHHNLGMAMSRLGRREEATKACLKATELAPAMAEPHLYLSNHFGLNRAPQEASFHSERFVELAYPYLAKYIPAAEVSVGVYGSAAGKGSAWRFWQRARSRR